HMDKDGDGKTALDCQVIDVAELIFGATKQGVPWFDTPIQVGASVRRCGLPRDTVSWGWKDLQTVLSIFRAATFLNGTFYRRAIVSSTRFFVRKGLVDSPSDLVTPIRGSQTWDGFTRKMGKPFCYNLVVTGCGLHSNILHTIVVICNDAEKYILLVNPEYLTPREHSDSSASSRWYRWPTSILTILKFRRNHKVFAKYWKGAVANFDCAWQCFSFLEQFDKRVGAGEGVVDLRGFRELKREWIK
ncbi:hypothetical protein HDU98_010951, partial [Podochytrium sp. JEL0797]